VPGSYIDKSSFADYLKSGQSATAAIQAATGIMPNIVTIAELDADIYIRYGVMMAGDTLVALVTLTIFKVNVRPDWLERIKSGEPAGAVLEGMVRWDTEVEEFDKAIRSSATMAVDDRVVGSVQEIFTESLFK
jgi:hypothetical protein